MKKPAAVALPVNRRGSRNTHGALSFPQLCFVYRVRTSRYAERRGDKVRRFYFYVPENVARQLREKAKAKNLSVPEYVAETMQRETHAGWPEGYF